MVGVSKKEDVTKAEVALKAKYRKLTKLKELAKAQANDVAVEGRKRPSEADDDRVEAAKRLLEAERRKASQNKAPGSIFLAKASAAKRSRPQTPPAHDSGPKREQTHPELPEERRSFVPQQQFVPAGYDNAGPAANQMPSGGAHHYHSGGYRGPVSDEGNQRTCFVGGLRPPVTDQDIYAHFQHIGNIEEVRCIGPKGIAFVTFDNPAAVETAIRTLHNQPLQPMGYNIRVSYARKPNHSHYGVPYPRQAPSTWTDQDSALTDLPTTGASGGEEPSRGPQDAREGHAREMVTYSDL